MFRLLLILTLFSASLCAQQKVNPVIPSYGGIYPIEEATVKPDGKLVYKIVVDVVTGSDDPQELSAGLNNVARMLNLHAVGGVPPGKMEVVLAIHGGATFATLNNELYQEKFGVDNPNIGLVRELKAAGVKLVVCGQSLIGRGISPEALQPEIELATSMLTTVSMYQMKGYAVFRF